MPTGARAFALGRAVLPPAITADDVAIALRGAGCTVSRFAYDRIVAVTPHWMPVTATRDRRGWRVMGGRDGIGIDTRPRCCTELRDLVRAADRRVAELDLLYGRQDEAERQ